MNEFIYFSGIEYVDSFNFNPHKWLLTNSDCSAMWFRNTKEAEEAFKIKSNISEEADVFEPDIRHWQIPSCRRFRALKLWFVMRIYGIEGLQKHIRHHVSLAKYLEELVRDDERFELFVSSLGVLCFRLIGEDSLTQRILDKISERKNLFIMPYYYQGKLVVRFVICSTFTERQDIIFAWREITHLAEEVLSRNTPALTPCKQIGMTNPVSANKGKQLSAGLFL